MVDVFTANVEVFAFWPPNIPEGSEDNKAYVKKKKVTL